MGEELAGKRTARRSRPSTSAITTGPTGAARRSPRSCSPACGSTRRACGSRFALPRADARLRRRELRAGFLARAGREARLDGTGIPSALLPGARPIWLVVVALALSPAWSSSRRNARDGRRPAHTHAMTARGWSSSGSGSTRARTRSTRSSHCRGDERGAAPHARLGRGCRRAARRVADRADDPPRHGPRGRRLGAPRRCDRPRGTPRVRGRGRSRRSRRSRRRARRLLEATARPAEGEQRF